MESETRIWDQVQNLFAIGDVVSCIVKAHHPFGVLVSLEHIPLGGVIERIRMDTDGFQTPDEYPPIGSVINAIVVGFRDYSRQVELAMPKKMAASDRQPLIEKLVE
jgi:ribosomal protein S1